MAQNTLVGIDLSFRNTGLVTAAPVHTELGYEILGHENVRTAKANKKKNLFVAQDDVLEAQKLYQGILKYVQDADPTALVVELPTAGAQGARANRCMGMATAIAASVVVTSGLPVRWIVPADSKVALCGSKQASKKEMIAKAKELWPTAKFPSAETNAEHIADACAALLVARDSDIYKFMRGRAE